MLNSEYDRKIEVYLLELGFDVVLTPLDGVTNVSAKGSKECIDNIIRREPDGARSPFFTIGTADDVDVSVHYAGGSSVRGSVTHVFNLERLKHRVVLNLEAVTECSYLQSVVDRAKEFSSKYLSGFF